METPRRLDRLFGRLAQALKVIAGKVRRQKPPAMIGLPPSARGLKAIPDDDETMPPEVSSLHDKSRASVRQDAIIAHEFEEGMRGNHEAAVEHAPDTILRIKDEARRVLKAQRERSI
jgi:hypothetical protein